jgi:hypothetical protein
MKYLKLYKIFENYYPNLNKEEILEIGSDLIDNGYNISIGDYSNVKGVSNSKYKEEEQFTLKIDKSSSYILMSEIRTDLIPFINRMSDKFRLVEYQIHAPEKMNFSYYKDKSGSNKKTIGGSNIYDLVKLNVIAITITITYEVK